MAVTPDDPAPAQVSDPSVLPAKRVGAGLLIRDSDGSVLLVKPTYKDGWEIPGGLVEPGESPREAARRECLEELGRDAEVGDLLCVHYSEGSRTPGDGVMFVFDGGIPGIPADAYELPAEELGDAKFVACAELGEYLPEALVRRVLAAAESVRTRAIAYLER